MILCSVNFPQFSCPHCRAALLTLPARNALIESLEKAIADTLAAEEAGREHAVAEAREAAGAFPTLAAAATASGGPLEAQPVPQTHKVLSLNSKTKRVIVASYTKAPPPSSQAVKGHIAEPVEPEPIRTTAPPAEVPFTTQPPNSERPWLNVRGGGVVVNYVPEATQDDESTQPSKKLSKKKRGESKGDSQQAAGGSSTAVRVFDSVHDSAVA